VTDFCHPLTHCTLDRIFQDLHARRGDVVLINSKSEQSGGRDTVCTLLSDEGCDSNIRMNKVR
jgi:hypothetical protein